MGTVLIALTLTPLIHAPTRSSDWGLSAATSSCFAISFGAGFAFIRVEGRVAVPLVYLALLRNRVLAGSTIAILIGAGTINALMYLLSLYFQDPTTLGLSPLEAGRATLPATVGLVLVAPLVPRLAAKFGGRQTNALGFTLTTAGFVIVGFVEASWAYSAFLVSLVASAVGMGLFAGPASAAATAAVPENQVGGASGASIIARCAGAAAAPRWPPPSTAMGSAPGLLPRPPPQPLPTRCRPQQQRAEPVRDRVESGRSTLEPIHTTYPASAPAMNDPPGCCRISGRTSPERFVSGSRVEDIAAIIRTAASVFSHIDRD